MTDFKVGDRVVVDSKGYYGKSVDGSSGEITLIVKSQEDGQFSLCYVLLDSSKHNAPLSFYRKELEKEVENEC